MKCIPSPIVCILAILAAMAGRGLAWPGDVDATFGTAFASAGNPPGNVLDPFPNVQWAASALAVQSDGKIVAAGAGTFFYVARFLKDGSPDPGFGEGGRVMTDIQPGWPSGTARLAVQADGKILAVGSVYSNSEPGDYYLSDVVMMRYLPDGRLDPTFGNAGIVRTGRPEFYDEGHDLALLGDGKILVLGITYKIETVLPPVTVLYRFLPDGSRDLGFGSAGQVEFPGTLCYRMAVQADGKIVLGSSVDVSGQTDSSRIALLRRASDGSADGSFGTNGTVLGAVLPGRAQNLTDLVVNSDGKILVAANTSINQAYDFLLARYHADGHPDLSFNGTGSVLTDFPPDPDGETDYLASALAVQGDGRLVVAGTVGRENSHFLTARFLTDGSLDTGFGSGGLAVGSVRGPCYSMALQPDGRIIAGGMSRWSPLNGFSISLTRILGGESPQGLAVEKPDGTRLTFRTTVDLGELAKGSTRPLETVLALRNNGAAPVSGLTASFYGPAASLFSLAAPLPAVLNGHSSALVTVHYAPESHVFISEAWLAITSGDSPPDSVVFALRAKTVLPVATLTVFDGSAPLESGGTVDLGASNAQFPATRTLTLKNTGNIDLLLQGVSLGAEGNPNDFSLGDPEADVLAPGSSTTLPVTMAASGPGVRTAVLRIASTDTFNPPFVVLLRGALPQGPDAWRLTHFGTLLNEGPAADLSDPDGDGRPNLLEYAFLTDPNSPSDTPPQLVKNGDNFEYTFNRPSDATGFLTYALESSISPDEKWFQEDITPFILSDDGTRVKLSVSIGVVPRLFVRIRVSRK